MSELPIRLVTFDLYDTLIELHPTRWERLGNALSSLGVAADLEALKAADLLAEDFFTQENTIKPIRDREPAARESFRLAYMVTWLDAAGIGYDDDLLRDIRRRYIAEYETPAVENPAGTGYRIYADVLPALATLQQAGVLRAVISNADDDVTELCRQMAFADAMDLIVTSALIGFEKPDVRTFQAALGTLGIAPGSALHIGDQPRSDVAGAMATGMRAALIDRYGRHDPAHQPAPVFGDLLQLADHVLEVNADIGVAR